jgi:menaquinone-dependent protoporphyrinogen oxidase
MRVLVTAASRHGATRSIANEVARELCAAGHAAYVLDPEQVTDLDGADAVVLGSAVHVGRWMPEARSLAGPLSDGLGERPVWLFSSGPVGDPPRRWTERVDIAEVQQQTHAVGHRGFGGRLHTCTFGRAERARAHRLRAADGDHRDWPDIRCWATDLACQLHTTTRRATRTDRP